MICVTGLLAGSVFGGISLAIARGKMKQPAEQRSADAYIDASSRISEMGIRYSSLPAHTAELAQALNDEFSAKWRDKRGIEIASFGISGMKLGEEDEAMIKELQRTAALRDPSMGAATLTGATADAMCAAASNTGGAAMAFMGMNMAQQPGAPAQAEAFARTAARR